jgi:AraC family transcriptional regulator
MHRISVVTNNEVVPLFSGKPLRDSRFSPWKGLLVETHHVGAVEVAEHQHSSLCLHMQMSGPVETEWWCDGKGGRQTTDAGSLMLLASGSKDSLMLNRPSRRVLVSIEESLLNRAAMEFEIKEPLVFENNWAFEDAQLRLLLSEIEREMLDNWSMGQLYGDLLGMSLSLALVRNYGQSALPVPLIKGGLPRSSLTRVLNYMNEYSHTSLRLADLADVAETSLFHFARLFHDCMGVPPHQYLTQLRIEKAKAMLRVPRFSMAQVAAATGFANSGHFAKTFRRVVGVTPSKFKAASES